MVERRVRIPDWADEIASGLARADSACAAIATALRAARRKGLEDAEGIAEDVARQEDVRTIGMPRDPGYQIGARAAAKAIRAEIAKESTDGK